MEEPPRGERGREGRSPIPLGALFLLAALTLVFGYGIYLKATGSRTILVEKPAAVGSAPKTFAKPAASMGHLERVHESGGTASGASAHDGGGERLSEPGSAERPLIPERPGPPAQSAPSGISGAAGAAGAPGSTSAPSDPPHDTAPLFPSPASSRNASQNPHDAAGGRDGLSADGERTVPHSSPPPADPALPPHQPTVATKPTSSSREPAAAPRSTGRSVPGRQEEPPHEAAPPAPAPPLAGEVPSPTAGAPRSIPPAVARPAPVAGAPRGSAPSSAERRAREAFESKKYAEAAREWKEWARTAPGASWTVQIAAIRLDRASNSKTLASLGSREGIFLLPSGTLPHGLAPVCVGIYPSAEDAKHAAESAARFPGSSSRPFARPLAPLAAGS